MRKLILIVLFSLLPLMAGAGEQVRMSSVAVPVHSSMQMADKMQHEMACCDEHASQCVSHDCDQSCDISCFLTHCTSSAQMMLPGGVIVPVVAAENKVFSLSVSLHSISAVPVTPPPRA